jgi:MerR family redox-sensitive transcriptional activator SoxR
MNTEMTIGQLASRSGVAASALRFYEDRGLIRSLRTTAGHRRYHRSVLRRIAFIVFAQKIGLSLDEVGEELGRLPGDEIPVKRDWSRLSGRWTRRIDERIAELKRLRDSLNHCIGCGCLSLEACKISNPGDRLGKRRSGPVNWTTEKPSPQKPL